MKNFNKIKREKRERRRCRAKAKVRGTSTRPRLSIFRSNKHIFLQLIDDTKSKTLVSVSDFQPKAGRPRAEKKSKMTKTEIAHAVGKQLAVLAKKKKIKYAVFDRGGYLYHGCVKAAAQGAREEGLIF